MMGFTTAVIIEIVLTLSFYFVAIGYQIYKRCRKDKSRKDKYKKSEVKEAELSGKPQEE